MTPRILALRGAAASLAAVVVFTACWDRLAGNGSEVENAVVAGRVVTPGGTAAAGVGVALVRDGYDPVTDPAKPPFKKTNSQGGYGFHADTGTYNVYGLQPGTGKTFLAQRIHITGTGRWDVGTDTLKSPGRIRVTLPDGSWEGAYAYLPGTPIAEPIGAGADSAREFYLDSVPEGNFNVLIVRKGDPSPIVVGEDVPVAPDAVTELPYSQWRHSALVRVDLAAAGLDLSSDVARLPLLLRLDAGNFDFSAAAPGGADLRFTNDRGVALAHRVQAWDAAAKSALVWIKADSVFAGDRVTRLRMYWGNDTVSAPPDSGVFSVGEGYRGVWHFDQRPAGNPIGFPDAGLAGDSAFAKGALTAADTLPVGDSGTAVSRADAVMGRGLHMNGTDAYVESEKTYPGPAGYAYSYWFKTATKQGGKIFAFVMPSLHGSIPGRAGNFNFDRVTWMDNDGFVRFGFTIASLDSSTIGTWQAFVSAKAYNDGQWHYVACSVSGSRALFEIDGEKVADYTGTMRALSIDGLWRLGWAGTGMWDPMWTSEYFRGSLDEVRIIHESRSEDWLRLDYASQKPGSKLLVIENP